MEVSLLASVQHILETSDPVWRFPEEKIELPLSKLWEDSAVFAGALADAGTGKGDRVGILCSSRHEYPSLLMAAWRLGAVAVPLRPVMGLSEDYEHYLHRVQQNCEFSAIVFETQDDSAMAGAWSAISGRQSLSIDKIISYGGKRFDDVAVNRPDDIAVIQYSSGSTGVPKGIIVTHHMVVRQVQMIASRYVVHAQRELDVNASWLPLNHDMGLFIGVLLPLYFGIPNILASPRYYMMNPLRWFKLMSEYKVGLNFTTNAAMAHSLKLLSKAQPGSLDLSRLQFYFGAEKLTAIVLRRTWEVFVDVLGMRKDQIHVGYGMAENALGATATSGPISLVRVRISEEGKVSLAAEDDVEALDIAAIGIPFDDTTVELRDDTGKSVPELTLGEVYITSPCVAPGYYRNEEATRLAIHDGWLRTHDRGFRYGGELFFHSRKDDLIITGGRNIVPDDIEQCAESLDSVRAGSSLLLALENTHTGATDLYLLVETKPLTSQEIADRKKLIQDLLFRSFALLISHVVFCGKGSIEKTSSGKKRRRVIKERFVKGELIVCDPSVTAS